MASDWGQFPDRGPLGTALFSSHVEWLLNQRTPSNEASGKCTKKNQDENKSSNTYYIGPDAKNTISAKKLQQIFSLKIMSVLCNFWPWTSCSPFSHSENKGYEGVKEHLETICFPLAWFNFCSFQCQQLSHVSYFKNVGKKEREEDEEKPHEPYLSHIALQLA